MSDQHCKQCKDGPCEHYIGNIPDPGCELADGIATITDDKCDRYVFGGNPYNPLLYPAKWAEWEALEKGRRHGDE
jgi:hypothetical protein